MKYTIRVWCLSASYKYTVEAESLSDAKSKVRRQVMPDMRGWTFSESEPDED